MTDRTMFPHAWRGRSADGGSNTACDLKTCGLPRLDPIHQNHAPVFVNHARTPAVDDDFLMLAPAEPVRLNCQATICNFYTSSPEKMQAHILGHVLEPKDKQPLGKQPPDPFEDALIPAVQAWDSFADHVRQIIVDKSMAYGDAWERQGWMGNLARVMSKTSRLQNMLWRSTPWLGTGDGESQEETEQVRDTAADLAALCAFLVANIDEENRWGH